VPAPSRWAGLQPPCFRGHGDHAALRSAGTEDKSSPLPCAERSPGAPSSLLFLLRQGFTAQPQPALPGDAVMSGRVAAPFPRGFAWSPSPAGAGCCWPFAWLHEAASLQQRPVWGCRGGTTRRDRPYPLPGDFCSCCVSLLRGTPKDPLSPGKTAGWVASLLPAVFCFTANSSCFATAAVCLSLSFQSEAVPLGPRGWLRNRPCSVGSASRWEPGAADSGTWEQTSPGHGVLPSTGSSVRTGRAAPQPGRAVGQDCHPFPATQTASVCCLSSPASRAARDGRRADVVLRRLRGPPQPGTSGTEGRRAVGPALPWGLLLKNDFAMFSEIFSEPVFSCSAQYCCIIWSVSSPFFWMRDLATEKGAKERQNLCGRLEISHLEIYPFLCTASCLRVSTPNCYTGVLARRWRARSAPASPRVTMPQPPPASPPPPSSPRAGLLGGGGTSPKG